MKSKLYRDEDHKKLAGVCAGLAEYFDVDVSLVRVIFVLAAVLGGGGGLAYGILWVVVPAKPYYAADEQYLASSQAPEAPKPVYAPVNKPIKSSRIIGGAILIILGVYLTLDQLDIIPEFDFGVFASITFIGIGLFLMFGFWKKKHDEKATEFSNTNDNTNYPTTTNS